MKEENIKSEMQSILDKMHWQLEQVELELRYKVNELKEKHFNQHHFVVDNQKNWFKKIVSYMSNGLTYAESLQLLCEENQLEYMEIKKVFAAFDYEKKAINTYAKIYAIKKLKKANFKISQIAKILEISTATVARLSRCEINLN